jgi:predicted unusual protein kinase regulating ubiquinone biosynthesis (AarF/ABC1/UbiB family)
MHIRRDLRLAAIQQTALLKHDPYSEDKPMTTRAQHTKNTPVPDRRSSRLWQLGRLAGGMAGGALSEGLKRMQRGEGLKLEQLLLTPANAKRLADQLAELRGAAMKLGQLISMEAGELLPAEFSALLARLRDDAHTMPLGQVADVLERNWGPGWDQDFSRFHFDPLAAASIGQVHEASTHKDQRRLAIKVQYPGIERSIDSDVDNVAGLLRLFRLLPEELDLNRLLTEAKHQLHQEADYLSEAEHLQRYRRLLADEAGFEVPEVIEDLTTREVLTMTYVDGLPIDRLVEQSREIRNRVAGELIRLALRECFDWGLVQTDPNFANYRYQLDTGRIGLLDFGATRQYPEQRVLQLRRLLSASVQHDRSAMEQAALEVGYLDAGAPAFYRDAIIELLSDVVEPVRHDGDYDFAGTDLASRMRDKVVRLRLEQRYWHLPPVDLLMLHRKLGGLYLMATRLKARVNVAMMIQPYLIAR